VLEETQANAFDIIQRYDKFATVRDLAVASLITRESK